MTDTTKIGSESPHKKTAAPPAASTLKSTLTCEIHPIFAYKNWLCLSAEDYERIKPALRLATMYMTTPAFLQFFATCLFSERSVEDRDHAWLEEDIALTTFKADRVKEMFADLDGVIEFTFQKIDNAGWTIGKTWADLTEDEKADLVWQQYREKSTPWSARKSLKHGKTVDEIEGEAVEFCFRDDYFFGDESETDGSEADDEWETESETDGPEADASGAEDGWETESETGGSEADDLEAEDEYATPIEESEKHLQDPRTRMTLCTLALTDQYLIDFKQKFDAPKQLLKEYYRLTNTLLHELAHAVEHGRPEHRECDIEEAVFPGDVLPELGCSLEMHVFGGTLFEDDMADGVDGASAAECDVDDTWLCSTQWPATSTCTYFIVPLTFLVRIQQQAFWDAAGDDDAAADQSRYLLPKTTLYGKSAQLARENVEELVEVVGEEYATQHYVIL